MQEFLDILDPNGEKTGKAVSYKEAHEKGFTHRSVHVWFINSQGQLLLQKRGSTKLAYPDHWDISAAGHVSANETSLEAAKKETREELGLDLADDAFEYLFTVQEHVVLNKGTYIANEFQDVYLVRMDVSASSLVLEDKEVEAVRWIDISELKEWLQGRGKRLVPHQEEYGRLLAILENK